MIAIVIRRYRPHIRTWLAWFMHGVTVVNGQNVTVSVGSVGVGVGRVVVVWGW